MIRNIIKNKKLILIICAVISFISGIGAGILIGDAAIRENVGNEANVHSTPQTGVNVDNIGVVSLLPDAKLEWVVYFERCDHECYDETDKDDLTGMTLQEIEEKYSAYNVKDFTASRARLVRTIDGYCPKHYVVRTTDNAICVYKRSEVTFEDTYIMNIDQELSELEDDFKIELEKGIPFLELDEINQYFENAES